MSPPAHPRTEFARRLFAGAAVLDVGCWQFGFARLCADLGLQGVRHSGIDREQPPGFDPPEGYDFRRIDLDKAPFPFPDESFDAVVASHVIEHLKQPFLMLDETFRVLKPGGLVYLECPSDRSLHLPSMPFQHETFRSLSFYDDPTHVGRPHTPQSFFRLLRMYDAEVLAARYIVSTHVRLRFPWLLCKALLRRDAAMLEDVVWKAVGFAVYGVGRKTAGSPRRYVLSA